MTQMIPFDYHGKQVRVLTNVHGELLWVGKDVCDILGITQYRHSLAKLDEDQKTRVPVVHTKGGSRQMICITESGLYEMILRSDKPEAKPFRKWVTGVVLPAIRKTGAYAIEDGKMPSPPKPGEHERAIANVYLAISNNYVFSAEVRTTAQIKALEALTGVDHSGLLEGAEIFAKPHLMDSLSIGRVLGLSKESVEQQLKRLGLHGAQDRNAEWSRLVISPRPFGVDDRTYFYHSERVIPLLKAGLQFSA